MGEEETLSPVALRQLQQYTMMIEKCGTRDNPISEFKADGEAVPILATSDLHALLTVRATFACCLICLIRPSMINPRVVFMLVDMRMPRSLCCDTPSVLVLRSPLQLLRGVVLQRHSRSQYRQPLSPLLFHLSSQVRCLPQSTSRAGRRPPWLKMGSGSGDFLVLRSGVGQNQH